MNGKVDGKVDGKADGKALVRKDSGAGVLEKATTTAGREAGGKEEKGEKRRSEVDKRKVVNGARVEFASEAEKRAFLTVVKEVQRTMRELPDLVGV